MGIERPRDASDLLPPRAARPSISGAKLYVVDPRRTGSAQWADGWLGLDVGTDIALANADGARDHRIAGLSQRERSSIDATTGFDEFRDARSNRARSMDGRARDGRPGGRLIRRLAHAYARADRAMLCWTLGHHRAHNAVDNVRALINLALL